jgi:hypothetical protein
MKGPREVARRITGHLIGQVLLIAFVFIIVAKIVQADGGIVLWQRTTGPFKVTVFSTQAPLRTGPADISILVESAGESRPIMDARVFIELQNEADGIVNAEATHRQARNKLLYCSLINLPEAGNWKMKTTVEHGGERAEMMGDLTVTRPQPMLLSYWQLIAFPPVIIILFIINQSLRRRHSESIN